jgi:hypothetical protein
VTLSIDARSAAAKVRSWSLDVFDDGMADSGGLAPEGTYTAVLTTDYGAAQNPAPVKSGPFVLDITPPTGSLSLSARAVFIHMRPQTRSH